MHCYQTQNITKTSDNQNKYCCDVITDKDVPSDITEYLQKIYSSCAKYSHGSIVVLVKKKIDSYHNIICAAKDDILKICLAEKGTLITN